MSETSTFQKLKNFLNSLEDEQQFTRQDIIRLAWDGQTIDVYRKGLQDAGFIERDGKSGQGRYIKVRDIPDYITSSNYRNKSFLRKIEMQKKIKML